MRQMATAFDHEGDADASAVGLFQPGLVDTEGLRDHIAAAHACGLPYAAWLASRLENGDAQTLQATAAIIVAAFHGIALQRDDLSAFVE